MSQVNIARDEFDYTALRRKFEKSNRKYIVEDEVDWFKFVHDKTPDNKFIPFLFIPCEKTETDRTITISVQKKNINADLIQTFSNNAFDYRYNMYMSPTCLFVPKRDSDNVWYPGYLYRFLST